MVEEKIVTINLRKQLVKVPKWRRRIDFLRILRKKIKGEDVKISQDLNEKIWQSKYHKFRLKIIKNDKSTKVELME